MPVPQADTLNRTFIRDDVYRCLRDWILRGDLQPGEKLRDKELAEQLGVSRTPIREALSKLESEGLIETAANRWTKVAPITLTDAERIYPIIQKLEELALTLAFPQLSAQHLRTMQDANHQLESALQNQNSYTAVQADAAFHQVLIEAANNTELSTILDQLKVKYSRIEFAYFSHADLLLASIAEHQAILTALQAKNLKAATQALTLNWQASIDRLKQAGAS
ncbi:MAG: GntR family transcriptional regulator [Oculatellaceae cyanobacterium Prado106]|jgi:DNA-binding GntR family transcriptional regulator|nr:GntR family transcriptional regulator [Oculatellaceae cyanobacterium Prado106]